MMQVEVTYSAYGEDEGRVVPVLQVGGEVEYMDNRQALKYAKQLLRTSELSKMVIVDCETGEVVLEIKRIDDAKREDEINKATFGGIDPAELAQIALDPYIAYLADIGHAGNGVAALKQLHRYGESLSEFLTEPRHADALVHSFICTDDSEEAVCDMAMMVVWIESIRDVQTYIDGILDSK